MDEILAMDDLVRELGAAAHDPACAVHDTDGLLCTCRLVARYACGHRVELPRAADPEPECACARHGDLMGLVAA